MENLQNLKFSLVYGVEHVRDGVVIDREIINNLAPTEMLEHILAAVFKSSIQQANWYIAPYQGNYVPVPGVTGATISAAASESTAYDEPARQIWVPGEVTNGAISNTDERAVFTFNAQRTIYGGFMMSSSGKGSGQGILASVVRFASPKSVGPADQLRFTAGTVLLNA